jgi:hypothetical protein
MPDKKKKTYLAAYKGLKEAMDELKIPGLLANYCMSDFESNIK